VNWYVELYARTLDTLGPWGLDECAHRTFWPSKDHRTGNGVDGGQREDRRVVIIDRDLVLAMMVHSAMRRHVAVNHELGMPMVFPFVDVLGRDNRKQADRQAQDARENPRHAHKRIVYDR
jgi:hypothetical protein